MSSYAISTTPLDVVIGRPYRLPIAYTAPDGVAINTAGMTIDAAVTWPGLSVPLLPTITDRVDLAGTATLTLSVNDTAEIPQGLLSTLRVTYTDSTGATDDGLYPVNGIAVLAGDLA